MKNIKIMIEYDGTDFSGWQRQPSRRTVQGEIERVLRRITSEKTNVKGSGRTDAGVHAIGQVANFFLEKDIRLERLMASMNSLLNNDVYIKSIELVSEDFDARFSAISRIYRYYLFLGRSPIKRRYVWEFSHPLNLDIMIKSVDIFKGEKDYTHLSTKDSGVCQVLRLDISKDSETVIFEIEANRFLRRMVRGIIGTLISLGTGKMKIDDLALIFLGEKKRPGIAPPQGLFLYKVKY